jgi:hypothetical protein
MKNFSRNLTRSGFVSRAALAGATAALSLLSFGACAQSAGLDSEPSGAAASESPTNRTAPAQPTAASEDSSRLDADNNNTPTAPSPTATNLKAGSGTNDIPYAGSDCGKLASAAEISKCRQSLQQQQQASERSTNARAKPAPSAADRGGEHSAPPPAAR